MVLRVQPVPAPAAGRDWSYTVPGNYQMDVKAVQATLLTPFASTSAADSSGNGLTLTITDTGSRLSWGTAGPYAGGANNYSVAGAQPAAFITCQLNTPTSALLGTANTTIEALAYLYSGTPNLLTVIAQRISGGNTEATVYFQNNTNNPADLRGLGSGSSFSLKTGFLPRNAWHHVAVTADGTNWRVYLDDVLQATVAGNQPPGGTTPHYAIGANANAFLGRLAAVAVYGSTLTAGQLAAHVAAMGSNAAYKAAVLADSPAGLWMLDDTGNMGSRKAVLEVTNGTTTVADFPGGSISGINGSFTWTWASQAPGTNQSADATINLVQIPDLILPGGYTIGTVTPDLGLADSWTNINIWWDDGTIGPGPPIGPYEYEGALLLPEGFTGG